TSRLSIVDLPRFLLDPGHHLVARVHVTSDKMLHGFGSFPGSPWSLSTTKSTRTGADAVIQSDPHSRSADIRCLWRKSRGPAKQLRATLADATNRGGSGSPLRVISLPLVDSISLEAFAAELRSAPASRKGNSPD